VSIEQVAHRAQSNSLPQPTLDLVAIRHSATASQSEAPDPSSTNQSRPDIDPWRLNIVDPSQEEHAAVSSFAATSGLGKNWWKHQRKVEITIIPEKQGFILARYTAYLITSDVSTQEA
jgi:sorting nexin-8